VGTRLHFGNALGECCGNFMKIAAPQALPTIAQTRVRARKVKSIFTLARQYLVCRL
jgi:hypothetical protein